MGSPSKLIFSDSFFQENFKFPLSIDLVDFQSVVPDPIETRTSGKLHGELFQSAFDSHCETTSGLTERQYPTWLFEYSCLDPSCLKDLKRDGFAIAARALGVFQF